MFRKYLVTFGMIVGIFFFTQSTFGQYVYDTIYGQVTTSNGTPVANLSINFEAYGCEPFTGGLAQTTIGGNYNLSIPFDCSLVLLPRVSDIRSRRVMFLSTMEHITR